ncbi:MAG TPA: hypothetical protein VG755_27320 [Nannocystaceae bacterium]|nr:hypothetical protein [Nannocystaceae bacterium]
MLRWTTLGVVVLSIAFSSLVDLLPIGGVSVGTMSARYPTPFTPAPYAFAIWGFIYAAQIAYCVAQLLPSRRSEAVFDKLAPWVMASNVLCAAWVAVFRYELLGVSVAIIVATSATALAAFLVASAAVQRGGHRFVLTVPFAALLGWLCVATIADVALVLSSYGWQGGRLGPQGWTVTMLATAVAIGCAVGIGFRQFVVPAVVAWAACAIWVADRSTYPTAATAALAAAGIAGLVALMLALARLLGHSSPVAGAHVLWLIRGEHVPRRAPGQ